MISYHVIRGLSRTFFNFFIFPFCCLAGSLFELPRESLCFKAFPQQRGLYYHRSFCLSTTFFIFFIFFHFFNIAFRIPHRRRQSGSLYKSKKKRQEMPCISCHFIYLSLYLFIALSSIINVLPVHLFLRKPDPRLSVRLKALRSALRIVRKCFWSFLKIKRFDQAPIRYL